MTVAYVTMPGTSGNYVSTADVNFVSADTSHFHQSIGVFGSWYQSAGHAQSQDLTPIIGDFHGVWNPSGVVDASYVKMGTSGTGGYPVSATTVYTVSAYLASDQADMEAGLRFTWYTAAGALISESSVVTTPLAAVNTFEHRTRTETSPGTAAFALVQAVMRPTAGNMAATDKCYVDAVCARSGAVGTFVPSLRIVGDLDMRARFAATDATPASAETLIGQRSGNSGYAMTLGTGGELVVYHGTGSGTRLETSSGLSLVAATDTEVQSTLDISAGTWTHYKNGVQYDSSGSFATTAGSPYAGPLAVGADSAGTSGNWDGDIYYAEVRDGIDGPVVRRFDADDLIGLV